MPTGFAPASGPAAAAAVGENGQPEAPIRMSGNPALASDSR